MQIVGLIVQRHLVVERNVGQLYWHIAHFSKEGPRLIDHLLVVRLLLRGLRRSEPAVQIVDRAGDASTAALSLAGPSSASMLRVLLLLTMFASGAMLRYAGRPWVWSP